MSPYSPPPHPAPTLLESSKMLAGQHGAQAGVAPTKCPLPQPPGSAPCWCLREPLVTHLDLDGKGQSKMPLPRDTARLEAHMLRDINQGAQRPRGGSCMAGGAGGGGCSGRRGGVETVPCRKSHSLWLCSPLKVPMVLFHLLAVLSAPP